MLCITSPDATHTHRNNWAQFWSIFSVGAHMCHIFGGPESSEDEQEEHGLVG